MSVIKSVSVGWGDMYYVEHNSDNFTIIDCMLPLDDRHRTAEIIDEVAGRSGMKGVTRFISTHPDQDHVRGLQQLDSRMGLRNFYCIRNAAKKEEPSSDFIHYCRLRDDPSKAFYIHKGCSRRWMNVGDRERGAAGISILWPDTNNPEFKAALECTARGESPNNTSAIIEYKLENGVTAVWMGDLETDFMESIEGDVELPSVDILFAPHHGRASGRVPAPWLNRMSPRVIVLGEADPADMHYYPGWQTITQNTAGDIAFDCLAGRVDAYVSSPTYSVDFLYDAGAAAGRGRYIGSFDVPA